MKLFATKKDVQNGVVYIDRATLSVKMNILIYRERWRVFYLMHEIQIRFPIRLNLLQWSPIYNDVPARGNKNFIILPWKFASVICKVTWAKSKVRKLEFRNNTNNLRTEFTFRLQIIQLKFNRDEQFRRQQFRVRFDIESHCFLIVRPS